MILEFLDKLFFEKKSKNQHHTSVAEKNEIIDDPQWHHCPSEKVESSKREQDEPASRREGDMSAEAELAYFLDRYLYDRFPNRQRYSSIERIKNRRDQLNGTDVRFIMKDGRVFNVDEKAQLYYLNKNLPTFAFEIQFLRYGTPTTGWLCNERLQTDYYMLIWPFADRNTLQDISWKDFTKVDCLMISKRSILSFLESKGLTMDRLLTDAEEIRRKHCTGKIRIDGLTGIYYFASYPQYYAEAPINIIISKAYLRHIAARRYLVTPSQLDVE